MIKGQGGGPDIYEKTHLDWKEEGSGSVTEDGFLWGDFTQITTTTYTWGEAKPNVSTKEYTQNWIGAISEDLDHVCIYRIAADEWFTLDWIRENGRDQLLNRFCEAFCPVP